ncbi:MAG: ribonuclease HII [Treponemataceae bacterium]
MICGIDEAGRGPLAGPVFAAAVILNYNFDVQALADSKKISASKRKNLYKKIIATCDVGVGVASVKEIDSLNILQATMLAMKRAYNSLIKKTAEKIKASEIFCIVDGNKKPNIPQAETRVKADATVYEVMAASIVAKVLRDNLMEYYGVKFPGYGFEKHKGYCTKAHLEAIYKLGESPIQRKSFKYPKA